MTREQIQNFVYALFSILQTAIESPKLLHPMFDAAQTALFEMMYDLLDKIEQLRSDLTLSEQMREGATKKVAQLNSDYQLMLNRHSELNVKYTTLLKNTKPSNKWSHAYAMLHLPTMEICKLAQEYGKKVEAIKAYRALIEDRLRRIGEVESNIIGLKESKDVMDWCEKNGVIDSVYTLGDILGKDIGEPMSMFAVKYEKGGNLFVYGPYVDEAQANDLISRYGDDQKYYTVHVISH